MKLGYKSIVINPEFPVKRMLGRNGDLNMACDDDLHCRILVIESDNKEQKPWYHLSIDGAEIWSEVVNKIKKVIIDTLGYEVDVVVSATHDHNCPCFTVDYKWTDYVLNKIRENINDIDIKEYRKLQYSYDYKFFDKVGKSREAEGKHMAIHLYAETLSFYGDGKRLGTILIHNCHPTIKKLWEGGFTSEYPGYCIRTLEKEYPGEFFDFLLGPAGDISPNRVREGKAYEDIIKLGDKIVEEVKRQLDKQRDIKDIDKFIYREKSIPNILTNFNENESGFIPPVERLTEEEKMILSRKLINTGSPFNRELEPMEHNDYHLFSQLILSEDYSIIYEPFELYSEYYGAVNKQTTTIASVSNGFEHYITGLYENHVVNFGSFNEFSKQMKKDMWELLGKWSLQEECDTF